jgi:predicted nucleic acid-binding protein
MTYFVDTNVLVYARDATDRNKQQCAHGWLEYLWRMQLGQLSFQVLQEYYVTVTQKLDPGMSKNDARDDVKAYLAWQPKGVDRTVIESAWEIQDRFGFSWWDSTIVAAAKLRDCAYLLSEDLQHEQDLGNLTVLNPFNTEIPTER